MKAKFVYESVHFERGIDPREGMEIGVEKRRMSKKNLKELSRISKIDISEEMDHILDLLDEWGATITDVDGDFCSGARGGDCAWVVWDLENGRDNGENFSYVKNPKPIPWIDQKTKWWRKKKSYQSDVWDKNDPHESGHNAEFFTNILGEIRYESLSGWPHRNTDDYNFKQADRELSFLNGK